MRRVAQIFLTRTKALGKDDSGVALVITLGVCLLLTILVSGVYAVGETIQQKIELQNAADAAAYSAAQVQADGLSRMATINRAMSWTYVQMTKRQMDYIVYRWLWLTVERFEEDYQNAKNFHCASEMLGGMTPLMPVGSNGRKKCSRHHKNETVGWWCGLDAGQHRCVDLNGSHYNIDDLKDVLNQYAPHWDESPGSGSGNTNGGASSGSSGGGTTPGASGGGNSSGTGGTGNGVGGTSGADTDLETKLLNIYNSQTVVTNGQTVAAHPSATDVEDSGFKQWLEGLGYKDGIDEVGDAFSQIEDVRNKMFEKYQDLTGSQLSPPTDQTDNAAAQRYLEFMTNFETWFDGLSQENLEYLLTNGVSGTRPPTPSASTVGTSVNSQTSLQASTPLANNLTSSGTIQSVATTTTTQNTPTSSSSFAHGEKLGKLIANDKLWIGLMNICLDTVSESVISSMVSVAEITLENNLKGKDYFHSLSVPMPRNPYSEFPADGSQDYFSPLFNTEAYERMFLAFADERPNRYLVDYFETDSARKTPEGFLASGGLEQWLIRGRNYQRWEGETSEDDLGIQRTYKDTEINDTGAGTLLSAFGRGNHTLTLFDRGSLSFDTTQRSGRSPIDQILGGILDSILDSIAQSLNQIVDVQPSCKHTKESRNKGTDSAKDMCATVADALGLYSEYRWASGKWYCAWHWGKWGRVKRDGCKVFSKFYCGKEPEDSVSKGLSTAFKCAGAVTGGAGAPVPSILGDIKNPKHGYIDKLLKNPKDFIDGFLDQYKPFLSSDKGRSVADYESCVVSPCLPGMRAFAKAGAYSPIPIFPLEFKGHARIYGDDKAIRDEHYTGAQCKPWILNEKFFNGGGTIVVNVATKLRNPFSVLFNRIDSAPRDRTVENETIGLHQIFNTPSRSDGEAADYMWVASAARAAVRHPSARDENGIEARANTRVYCVSYNGNADADSLTPNSGRYGGWCNPDSSPKIGCVCHDDNVRKLSKIWNLCEPDWDATLLPLRYAYSGVEFDTDDIKWKLHLSADEHPMVFGMNDGKGRTLQSVSDLLTVSPGQVDNWGQGEIDVRKLIFNKFY